MDQKMREEVAKEIAAIAVFMRERQFSFCLCSGDMTEEEKNSFIKTFTECLEAGCKALHQPPDGNHFISDTIE